jgi:5-methyltetrahydropteroyltriglutamate--homocysteine methyltransferase
VLRESAAIAMDDQREAGLDEWTGGETSTDSFILHLPRRLSGLKRIDRSAWGGRGSFQLEGTLAAPRGLGYAEAFVREREIDPALVRVCLPGPSELVMMISDPPRDRLIPDALELIRAEIGDLIAAGAEYIQVDLPHVAMALADRRMEVQQAHDLVRTIFDGVHATRAIHLCYGDFEARSWVENRELAPLIPFLATLGGVVDRIVLELSLPEQWAQRKMLAEVPDSVEVAAGIVDVKSPVVEPRYEIRARLDSLLTILPAERLLVCPSCGFGRRPRAIAQPKIRAMVDAAKSL